MKKLLKVLLYLWELPQNIIGLLFLLFIKGETKHKLGNIYFYYSKDFPGGITLGEYIILGSKKEFDVKHEYGHVIQSRILGPIFLIVIGIPSLLHAYLSDYIKCCEKHSDGYYHFYTEKWANKLSKIR